MSEVKPIEKQYLVINPPSSGNLNMTIMETPNSIIERCARVAENFNAAGKPIAAAIRALKDKS